MKYFNKTLIFLVVVAWFSSSCATSNSIKVEPIQPTTILTPSSFVFYYPKTVLSFHVSSLHQRFLPGPYADYAQKYLGVAFANTEPQESWQILQVSLTKNIEPDFSRLFSVAGTPSDVAKVFNAIRSESIFPENDSHSTGLPAKPAVFPISSFLDLGVAPFISNEKSVFYNRVQVDSGFVKVPVQKNIVVEANMEEKAKAAAEFVFSLRKRRFDLVTGDVEHVVDGKALEISLAELKRLEDSYLSLFVGKTFSDTTTLYYTFVPTAATSQNAILFRFSESNGLLSDDNFSGRPVMLELVAEKNQEPLKQLTQNTASKKSVSFPYLFPEVCSVVITDGKNTLYKQRVTINQLGNVVSFPVSVLK